MDILNTFSLESNKQLKINFNGGELSSDAGMLLLKEFAHKIRFEKIISDYFKTNDKAIRKHNDTQNAMQKIYQCIAGYFQDDDSDDLKKIRFLLLYSTRILLLHSQHYHVLSTVVTISA